MENFVLDLVKKTVVSDYIVWFCYSDWQPTQKFLNLSTNDTKFPRPTFVFLEDENYIFVIERTRQIVAKGARNIISYCDSEKLSRLLNQAYYAGLIRTNINFVFMEPNIFTDFDRLCSEILITIQSITVFMVFSGG